MPTIITRGAMSALGFGFTQVSVGTGYVAYYTPSSNSLRGAGIGIYPANGNSYIIGYNTTTRQFPFLSKISSAGVFQWTIQYGSISNSADISSVAFDSSENVYFVGSLLSGCIFVGILAKYNSSGSLLLSRYWLTYANGDPIVVLGSSGNIYVSGRESAGCVCCLDYIMIRKLDSSGNGVWSKMIGNSAAFDNFNHGIAIDSSDNLFATVDPGGVVLKFDSSGSLLWQKISSIANMSFGSCATDSSGNIYAAGNVYSGGPIATLAKLDSSGAFQWARRITGLDFSSVATDASGNVYVVANSASIGVKIFKYNSSGTLQWQRLFTITGATYTYVASISIDNINKCFAISGTLTPSSGPSDSTYVAKFPLSGAKTGSYSVGGQTYVYATNSDTETAYSMTFSNTSVTISSGTNGTSASSYGALTNLVPTPSVTVI